jgi:two-component system chemotaxis sensor kinase CheA
MAELQEAAKEFLIESHENLDQLDTDLVGLEKSAAPGQALGRIFRTLHTIKGSCSFLGFPHLEAVAHAGEDLLGKLRDGKLALSPAITEALLRMVDAIRRMLASVENTGTDGNAAEADLINLLNQLATKPPVAGTVAAQLASKPPVAGTVVAQHGQKDHIPRASSLDFALSEDVATPTEDFSASTAGIEPPASSEGSAVYDASVRINVDLLDKLMTVAGEIVLARNQILQYSQQYGDPAFQNTCRQLNLITTELQEHVMKTRLQPLGNVWNRFPRLVRDAAYACGKKVRLETEGSETELDKTLIEAIRDPLTHLVRNAIDHGIEAPERRLAVGKPEEGCVRLRAYHEGGQVNVEISDDGGGIDPERIKERAIEQRLITPEQAARMGTQTLLGLIFLPGFSTAPTVTTVSGRGVGMDVVKTNIEKIGGSVDVQSTVGQGTTVRIRIPLTLAIIKVLVVTSAGDRYAIPQVSLLELVRIEGEQAKRGIELIHDAPVYRLRGNLLPLVYLHLQLQSEPSLRWDAAGPGDPGDRGEINIVVLQADNRQFGLVVDAVHDTEEIVVKPLQKQLKGISAFAGATIMGDGRVALILDVLGLAQRAKVLTGARERAVGEPSTAAAERAADRQTVLLFARHDGGHMAIPLALVDRLEEFPRSAVERVGSQNVVQYRDEILPLVHVSQVLRRRSRTVNNRRSNSRRRAHRDPPANESGTIQVVVFTGKGQRVGLVVDRILDIAEETLVARSNVRCPGVLFTAVIQGRVTEFLDVEAVLRCVDLDVLEASPTTAAEA